MRLRRDLGELRARSARIHHMLLTLDVSVVPHSNHDTVASFVDIALAAMRKANDLIGAELTRAYLPPPAIVPPPVTEPVAVLTDADREVAQEAGGRA